MPPPRTKATIIARLETERRRLVQNLTDLTSTDLCTPGAVGEWTLKDLLAHLADWESRMPDWVDASRRGETTVTPEPDLTWKQLDEFNRRVYERHRERSLEDVLAYFHRMHEEFMEMVRAMPEEEMLTPGYHAFTGKGAVYDWLSAYAAHDLWGKKKIINWKKHNQ
jgi:hypothetical protein